MSVPKEEIWPPSESPDDDLRVIDQKSKSHPDRQLKQQQTVYGVSRHFEDASVADKISKAQHSKRPVVEVEKHSVGNDVAGTGIIRNLCLQITSPARNIGQIFSAGQKENTHHRSAQSGIEKQSSKDELTRNDTVNSFPRETREAKYHADQDVSGWQHGDNSLREERQQPTRTQPLKWERKAVIEHIRRLEKSNQELKDRCADAEAEAESKDHQRQQLRAKFNQVLESCHQEIETLKEDKAELMKNLEECKDRVFNMQPVQGMADTQLRDQYDHVCNDIEYWVENHFSEVENVIHPLLDARVDEKSPDTLNVVPFSTAKEHLDAIEDHPEIELTMFQGAISRYLHLNLLERIVPGLPLGCELLLSDIIKGMESLKPVKGKIPHQLHISLIGILTDTEAEAIQSWRVDLQRSLNVLDPIREIRDQEVQKIEETIMKCLVDLRRMDFQGGIEQGQCRQFVQDAADLANNIRQSTNQYEFDFDSAIRGSQGDGGFKQEDLKKYKIVDSMTGYLLRSSARPVTAPDGRVGKVIFVVHPAFVRKSTTSSQEIVLVKATIVVKFDHPIPRQGRGKR